MLDALCLLLGALSLLLGALCLLLDTLCLLLDTLCLLLGALCLFLGALSRLFTRVNNALKASNSTVQADETAKTIFRKLQGKRASAKLTEEQKAALLAEGKEVNQISTSQLGYDDRVENFESLISFLQTVPEYNPNEEELKITTLQVLLADLKAKNMTAMQAHIAESTARGARKTLQNTPLTGLVDVANDVKSYIKSVYGIKSTEYKLVSKLRFVKF